MVVVLCIICYWHIDRLLKKQFQKKPGPHRTSKMNPKVFQIVFFLVAVIISIYNVHNRFFTKKVNIQGVSKKTVT